VSRVARIVGAYPELLLVLCAAGIGLAVSRPLRWLDSHQGINAFLAVLVFATAVTVPIDALGRLAARWRRLAVALVAGATVLPAVSWVASRIVSAGPLRNGIMAVGLAPCEIASVATTALAGGDPAIAAAVLIGSTVLSVATAGAILSLEASGAQVHPLHILVNLAVVVALPLAAGLLLRAKAGITGGREAAARKTATAALGVLVALVAAQVNLATTYVAVFAAIVIIIGVSAGLGLALGRATTTDLSIPLLLTSSMRDFAIAAGLASTAFGASAAAPLGLYGVLVIVWGTAIAGRLRAKNASAPQRKFTRRLRG
jgi:BASS family bile acid:Na+ symporter